MNIFNGNYLFQTPPYAPSWVFGVLTAGFGVLLVLSAAAYWRRGKLARGNSILRRFIRRAASAGMWYGALGLFVAGMRYLGIDYLAIPFWMYLLILAMIVTIGYFVYDYSERYPVAVWKLQQSTAERRYRPAPRPRTEPQRPRPKVRGKRRR